MSSQRRGGLSAQTSNQGAIGRGASRAPSSRMPISDLYALMMGMEARMNAQDEEIRVLKKDNAALWQEVHRLKGPRFPFEIFSAIILSIEEEKKALTTFSLVSRGWMSVTRRVLFENIQYSAAIWSTQYQKIDPLPILSNEYCTIFSSVQHIDLTGTARGTDSPYRMDGFLRRMSKFVALRSLLLSNVTTLDLKEIQHSMSPSIRNSIKELYLQRRSPHHISDLAAFVSKFNALDTLASSPYSQDEIPETIHCLVPPPPSIRDLVLWRSDREDRIAPAMLKWFTDLHSGTIDSIDPGGLPFESPVEFAAFLTRFGSNITRIRFSFEEDEDEIQFLRLGHAYCAALPQLKFIEIEFLGEAFAYSLADKSFLRIIELLPKIVALLSPSIEEIILTVRTNPLHCEDGLGTIDWPQLDRSLTGSQYPLLKKLKVQIPGFAADDINQHLKDLWLKVLPICARKGMLEIDVYC